VVTGVVVMMFENLWTRITSTITKIVTGMADKQKTLTFWVNPLGTTAAVSTSGTSTITNLTTIQIPAAPSTSDEDLKNLVKESYEANAVFEAAKMVFQKKHGFEWNPHIKFTSDDAIADSQKIIALRDKATHLFAKVLAASRK
jgi:hypothetical protein